MALERIIDQHRARTLIERMVTEGRLPHALLFWGPPGSGKSVAALELARWLNCEAGLSGPCGRCDSCRQFRTLEHPHFTYLLPVPGKYLTDAETGELSQTGAEELAEIFKRKGEDPYHAAEVSGAQGILIGQIRSLLLWASRKSFTGRPRVALVDHADRLREEAGNALLKLLEEPPDNFILVLTAAAPEDLLPTLRSRCQTVEFDRLKPETVAGELTRRFGLENGMAQQAARVSGGNLSRALEIAAEPERAAELHELAVNLVRHALGRNPLEFDALMENWLQKESADQRLVLNVMAAWFRDAAVLQALGEAGESRVLHRERLDLLRRFVANCPVADFIQAAEQVEEARRRLDGNILPSLTLIHLSRELYRAVYQKTAV